MLLGSWSLFDTIVCFLVFSLQLRDKQAGFYAHRFNRLAGWWVSFLLMNELHDGSGGIPWD